MANSDYPPGRPYISNITFKFFSRDEDLVKALENGSVDSAYGHPVGRTLTAPYARVFGIFFNSNNNEVFTRIEVRKALSVALDRGAIVEDILGGYAMAILGPVPPGSGIIPTPVPTYDDSIAEAADTLERNGWEYDEEERMWGHDNAELSLTTITIKTSNVPELKAIASSVKQNWEALGIPVAIELYEPGDLNQNVIRPRKYEALLFGMVIGRDKDLYAFWYSGERNDPGLNIALYTNKDVDSLLETAREESNPTERLAALQQIEDEVASEYPAAFTHVPHFTYSVPEKLGGVMLPQIATPSDRFATVASWHMRTEAVWPFFVPER
jgi:peptide/nickel transport system substrate-binding protein